jgi:ArsR family transcriptional regulator
MDIRIFGYPYAAVPAMITPPEVFKSLADETRARATLLITSQGELCVCELMFALEDSQPKISRHLAQLRTSGILLDRRQGQWVYYRLNPHLPAWVTETLQITLDANAEWLQHSAQRLLNMEGRPIRDGLCC